MYVTHSAIKEQGILCFNMPKPKPKPKSIPPLLRYSLSGRKLHDLGLSYMQTRIYREIEHFVNAMADVIITRVRRDMNVIMTTAEPELLEALCTERGMTSARNVMLQYTKEQIDELYSTFCVDTGWAGATNINWNAETMPDDILHMINGVGIQEELNSAFEEGILLERITYV